MWTTLKTRFEGTIVIKMCVLTVKLDTYRMQCGDSMPVHLRKMSGMISDLKAVGNNLIDEQQIHVIRCLLDSWEQMKINVIHNETIHMLED